MPRAGNYRFSPKRNSLIVGTNKYRLVEAPNSRQVKKKFYPLSTARSVGEREFFSLAAMGEAPNLLSYWSPLGCLSIVPPTVYNC